MKDSESRIFRIESTGRVFGANADNEVSSDDLVAIPREGNSEKFKDLEEDSASKRMEDKYPADCYSFLSLHSPFEQPKFFAFGIIVWIFQMTFHILMVLRVAGGRKLSENEDMDNPDNGFLAYFIPSNVSSLSRITQFMALLAYCVFADESLKDIVKAVETFPNPSKIRDGDRLRCMIFACILRFSQGVLATVVVFLMVVNTQDVVDIILNFTAVNFISGFDEVAFELAHWGKYGPDFKAEARRIEELTVPDCIFRKYDHVRYVWTVIPVALTLIILISSVAVGQTSEKIWLTQRFRVQFRDGSVFESYSGCYDLDTNSTSWGRKRKDYVSFNANTQNARFGYCIDNRKWYLFTGNVTDACSIDESDKIIYSSKTYFFDISMTFEDVWYSSSGKPLQLYFFDENVDLNEGQCSSFVGDGICNSYFNLPDYDYDEGDCCAPTCTEAVCGVGALTRVFETDIVSGNGYQNCNDPLLKPITIFLDDVYIPHNYEIFSDVFPRGATKEPLLMLDCDGQNVLMVSVSKEMEKKAEEVMVADGAKCIMIIKNSTFAGDIYFVKYTIYHGDKMSMDKDPIVMAKGDSYDSSVVYFDRTEDCFLRKLGNHINKTTMYTGNDPSNQAIRWLMKDSKRYSNCERKEFLERYALTVINFAAPMYNRDVTNREIATVTDEKQLWISTGRHCLWRPVSCTANIVTELNYFALGDRNITGTIATEIGLLKNLTKIGLSASNLYGSIPTQIGELSLLDSLRMNNNNLSGTIPTEIGALTSLKSMLLKENVLSGPIPSQIGKIESLEIFWVWSNALTGSIPSEIGGLSNVLDFVAASNLLTGTIPTEVKNLKNLRYFDSVENSLTGTIPNELAESDEIQVIRLYSNNLVGSIPSEIFHRDSLSSIEVYGNKLSNLQPINGFAICSAWGGEHYCDCKNQCVQDPDIPNHCACQEAQSCCTSLLEEYDECIVCEGGYENGNKFLPEVGTTCDELSRLARIRITEYGNKENCTKFEIYLENLGCRCKQNIDCHVCASGLANPDFFVDDWNGTCYDAKQFLTQNSAVFETETDCFDARMTALELGCRCKNPEEEPTLEEKPPAEEAVAMTGDLNITEGPECIICEFGLENEDLFVEDYQMSCIDASTFIRKNTSFYGTTAACDQSRIGVMESGCKCKDSPMPVLEEGNLVLEEDSALPLEEVGENIGLEEYGECIICEFGLENGEFFLENLQTSCANRLTYIEGNLEEFGTKTACDEIRLNLTQSGCKCKTMLALNEEEAGFVENPTSIGGN